MNKTPRNILLPAQCSAQCSLKSTMVMLVFGVQRGLTDSEIEGPTKPGCLWAVNPSYLIACFKPFKIKV